MFASSTNSEDSGTEITSGTATGGSLTTLENSFNGDFITDGVLAGQVLINDSTGQFGIITSVAPTIMTHTAMTNASQVQPLSTANDNVDIYRVGANSGNGMGVAHFLGLDSNWDLQSETVILNGVTNVAMQQDYIRMHRAFAIIATDPNNANLGIIKAFDQGDATAIGVVIAVGSGQTEQAIISVPRDKTGFFLQGYVGLNHSSFPQNTSTEFTWKARTFGGCFRVNGRMACNNVGSGWWQYSYKGSPGLPAMSDAKITCVSCTDDGVSIVGGIDLLLVDNDKL
jgi:hypothetical protein